MKTEELIRALVADGGRPASVSRALVLHLGIGAALTLALFFVTLHVRADVTAALHTIPFVFKLILPLVLLLASASLLTQYSRPVPGDRRPGILLLAPALLAAGVIVELLTQPSNAWLPRLIGHNGVHCLSIIPMLSLAPAVSVLLAMRRGAPAQPASAGALAGIASGAIGAALYALTCPDDSPLFVATWYSIAILSVTAGTAIAGCRLLRW